ncbi:MAG: AMP-dependent synthetase [Ruminococcaceae bacterium]|nr:AMP-dependent synthetase [Oscillospiraceae bacterium]
MAKNNDGKKQIKAITSPKTPRKYERVMDAYDLCRILAKHGDRTAFTYYNKNKQIYSISYVRFYNRIVRTAAGLTKYGLAGKKVAIIGETSVAWLATYLAVLVTGGVAIPMDKELEINSIIGLLNSVDADAIVYSDHFNGKFTDEIKEKSCISTFIPVDPTDEELAHSKTVAYRKLRADGKADVDAGRFSLSPVADREKMAEMLFTSGTTGTSKCVMLSQKNIFSVVTSACETVDFGPDDVIVSVLPIHHTYELAVMLAELDYGAQICINDSLTKVLKNFQLFKPTGLVLVPLFVYTMYKRIWAEAKKTGQENKLKLGINSSRALRRMGIDKREALFGEVTKAFGGRLKKIICGGAALNPRMIEFFDDIGISIYEGFGITECAPLTFVTPYYARKIGSVGPAVPCCQGRIDGSGIGSHGYIEGEIQIKGDNVMLGYYNNSEATEAAFTEDGWFRTGDMGYMDDDGYFYVTGRLKSVIVLENGKNIFPEEIEEYLSNIEYVAESVVVGRQCGSTVNLVAIVYPDLTKFSRDATANEIYAIVEKAVHQLNHKLPSHKQIKKIEIREKEFEKTTSKKIKRHLVK